MENAPTLSQLRFMAWRLPRLNAGGQSLFNPTAVEAELSAPAGGKRRKEGMVQHAR
jgi:hypothetical protein